MFMDNMLVKSIVAVLFVGYVSYTTFKSVKLFLTYKEKKVNFLDVHKDATLYSDSKLWYIGAAVLSVFSTGMAVLAYTNPAVSNYKDPFYFVLAYICIAIIFVGLAFETFVRKRVYFFQDGIFYVDQIYRYRAMMNFEARKGVVRNIRILVAGGEKFEVSKKMGLLIEEKARSRREDKKGRKKK